MTPLIYSDNYDLSIPFASQNLLNLRDFFETESSLLEGHSLFINFLLFVMQVVIDCHFYDR